MLKLIGLGLNVKQLTLEALEEIKECNEIMLEGYTSYYSEGNIQELEEIIKKKVKVLDRREVEEGIKGIIEKAKEKKIALLIFGNPMSATTHKEFLIECKKQGIKCKVIPGISIISVMPMITGLEEYNFGRIISIPFWKENWKATSFYEKIKKNYKNKMHSLCLLDLELNLKKNKKEFMNAKTALKMLKKISEEKKENWLNKTIIIVIEAAYSKKQKIIIGKLEKLIEKKYESYPQSIIITTELNEKEKESIESIKSD